MSPEFQKRIYKMLDSGIYVDEAFMSTSIHNTAERMIYTKKENNWRIIWVTVKRIYKSIMEKHNK